jgi:hypothetical protein
MYDEPILFSLSRNALAAIKKYKQKCALELGKTAGIMVHAE